MSEAAANTDWQRIDQFVERFEHARSKGPIDDLIAYAPQPNDSLHLAILGELVRVDMEFNWAEDRPVALSAYQQRFPNLFSSVGKSSELAFEEYRLRRTAGEQPSFDEYRDR